MNDTYKHIQEEEAATWLIENEKERNEKAMREVIRYQLIKKQIGLNNLDTGEMEVWDIGAGPLGGVSQVVNCKKAVCIDPLTNEYKKYFPCTNYVNATAESLKEKLATPDLIIITNALDHFENPQEFLGDLVKYMKYGAYFAHLHAINNAITHPHNAHQFNINPQLLKHSFGKVFETCWYMDYKEDGLTYGWRFQPAFAGLYRKVKK